MGSAHDLYHIYPLGQMADLKLHFGLMDFLLSNETSAYVQKTDKGSTASGNMQQVIGWIRVDGVGIGVRTIGACASALVSRAVVTLHQSAGKV